MNKLGLIFFVLVTLTGNFRFACNAIKTGNKKPIIENPVDIKDLKKLLRTKTNVLICFYNSFKQSQNIIKLVQEVADSIKGEGTIALVDCSGDSKKMCKKLKIPTHEPYVLKHYKEGEFNRDYDRKYTAASMTNFMRDPTGDLPWEEDAAANDVVHVPDPASLARLLKKEIRPILIMFYAPWCGYCKSLKPEYSEAARELKDEAVLAAMDVNRPENTGVRVRYNVTGFPTLQYFENGALRFTYEGENKKAALVEFVRNPAAPPVKIQEPDWSETDNEVVHLTATSFDPVIKEESSVLVMFYAPWCGHCKKMKPEYETAAAQMKHEGIPGVLAAVDATKEQSIASRYAVKGFPTVLYFSYGERRFDVNARDSRKIVEFMRDPREPPPPPPPEKPWSEEGDDVVHLTEETFKPFLKRKKHALVMFYAPWCGHCKRAKPEFSAAASEFRDDTRVEFAAVDCTAHAALCGALDVKGYPTLTYFSYYNKAQLPYAGGRTKADFVEFVSNPVGGGAVPRESWVIDPVLLNLTGKNFKATLQSNELVLVMFYAPWCGHCKKMKPEYVAAARELEREGLGRRLAVVDCTENPDLAEEYRVQGFPTIKLFRDGVYVADYDGKRSADDIKAFVREHYPRRKEEL
ncbi:protein disulfide-isomerase A5 [Cylas formicarius]|uniref:protein disulfide-isomerase A5 n=1 Tax=Cylas formicarius TaxID=197179 RepID=UPI002958DBE5|nr:protein disulfide-isomerase A5 [Cylas formicarius]